MAGVKLDSRGWLEQPSLGRMSVSGVGADDYYDDKACFKGCPEEDLG